MLFVDTGNYMPSVVTETRGARATIHPSDVTPLVAEAGMEISPASLTSISMSEVGGRSARAAMCSRPGAVTTRYNGYPDTPDRRVGTTSLAVSSPIAATEFAGEKIILGVARCSDWIGIDF